MTAPPLSPRVRGLLPRVSVWWLAGAPLLFLALFFVWPSAALVWRGLTDAGADGQGIAWQRILQVTCTTLGLAAAGTAASLLIGLPAAWALYRMSWPGQRFARAVAGIPFVLPTVVVGTALNVTLRQWGAMSSEAALTAGIVAGLAFFNVSVVVRFVGPRWEALDQGPLIAASTLGASPRRAAWHVTLPALKPAIVAASAAVMLFCTASFGIVLVVGSGRVSTVETQIWFEANQFLNLGAAATLSIVQVAIVTVTMFAASRLGAGHAPEGARKLRVSSARKASRADLPRIALALAPAVTIVALPLATLAWRSMTVRGRFGFDHYVALASAPRSTTMPTTVPEAAMNSLESAAVAGVVAVTLALSVVVVVARRPRAAWILPAVLLPLGVSSVVVGLGTLVTLNRPLPGGIDLSDPAILIPAAQAVVALPLVTLAILPALRAIHPRMRWAAATLGASPWEVWWRVEWPLVRSAVGQAAGLAFAVSLGEFGATSFLARPEHMTLPTVMYRLLGRPGPDNVGMAMATAVILAAITGTIMLALDARGTTKGASS